MLAEVARLKAELRRETDRNEVRSKARAVAKRCGRGWNMMAMRVLSRVMTAQATGGDDQNTEGEVIQGMI